MTTETVYWLDAVAVSWPVQVLCTVGARGYQVRTRLQVTGGRDTAAELASLWDWLRREPELRGWVELERPTLATDDMGAVSDALIVAVGSGGVLTALASSLSVWLRHRHSDVEIEVTGDDGRHVRIEGRRVTDVVGLVQQALGDPGRSEKD